MDFLADSFGILIILLVFWGIYKVWKYFERQKIEAQQRREEQFYREREKIRRAAEIYSDSELVEALCSRIRKLPESPEIKRIDIGTDCMTVTLDGLLKTEPKKTVPYTSLTYKDLKPENCPLVACALAVKLGVPFHVEFLENYPTAALVVVKEKLLDPNIELQ